MELRKHDFFSGSMPAILLGLLSIAIPIPQACGQSYLYNEIQLQAANGAQGMISADLNGDGILDLVVANAKSDTVSVFMGMKGGLFASQVAYVVSGAPSAVVTEDLNNDGKLDLAVVSTNWGLPDGVFVLLGNGDGTFQSPVAYAAGLNSSGIVAVDLNGDGKPDLATANGGQSSPATVSIFFGNGNGTFQNQVTVDVGTGPVGIAEGDFNGDGEPDLVTPNENDNSLSVLLNDGNGTFQRKDTSTSSCGDGPFAVALGDFNQDGKLDAILSTGPDLCYLQGNGDGTFEVPVQISGLIDAALAVGDVNHDGKLDLVAGAGPGTVLTFFGNGDGTFQQPIGNVLHRPESLLLADFNGDGQLDVAETELLSSYAYIVLGNGNGTFGSQLTTTLPSANYPGAAVVADFNKDGKLDVAAIEEPGGANEFVSMALGNGDGSFQTPTQFGLDTPSIGSVAEGDFNGDGNPDLAVTTQSGKVSVLLGDGKGGLGAPIDTSLPSGQYAGLLAAGDFDGSGKTDLAVTTGDSTGNNSVSILLSNGDGTFKAGASYAVGMYASDPDPSVLAADFVGNGKLDLAVGNYAIGGLYILLGKGDGTFFSPTSASSFFPGGPITVGDFNGDGQVDLAYSSVTVQLGNGDGTFGPPIYSSSGIGAGITSYVTGDFNADGKTDLAGSLGLSPIILLGEGDGTFQRAIFTGSDSTGGLGNVASGDFNADGTPDLVFELVSPQSATLNVFLSWPFVSLSPSPLNFGSERVGESSLPQNVTLTNIGNATLSVTTVTADGDFSQTNGCSTTLAPGTSCTISLTFSPTTSGPFTGTLTIGDNALTSPQVVALSGTGTYVSVSPASLNFGNQTQHTTSLSQSVTLTNYGASALAITSITATGEFEEGNSCGTSLAGGASCTINVTFSPVGAGSLAGTITVVDSDPASPQTVSLSGIGVSGLAQSPTLTVDFFGDGEGEPAVFRPSDGTWYVHSNSHSSGNLQQSWGQSGDIPESADYDSDGKSDFALWRPSNGTWYIIPSGNPKGHITTQWGSPGDVPVPADYDGDGKSDIAVWRPGNGTWYILPSKGGPSITKQHGQSGDVPVIGDYDGDAKADYAVWRPSNGTWYVSLSSTGKSVSTPYGSPGDIPVEGDYDGDGKTDYAVWRPSNGTWYVLLSSTGKSVSTSYGTIGDIPVVGDYNGDGKNDYAVFRPSNGTWYIEYSSGGSESIQYGETGDIPATHLPSMIRRDKHVANFDGDRKTDIAFFRPSNGTWYVIDSSTGQSTSQAYGANGDLIVPGDYDGDGKTDYAVWRPSNQTWYVMLSSTGKSVNQQWGASGDIPVPDDYDGDGKTDYAIFRPSDGTWHVILSSTGTSVKQSYGTTGDIPVPADYDGDGKTDYAVFRPSTATWYVILSSTGASTHQQWGATGDIPVPGDYDGDTKADYTVFRPSDGTWHTIQSSTGKSITRSYGANGDIPVAKDYDGDEKTDIAVFRPSTGTWYILQSSNGKSTKTIWGLSTDVPVSLPTGQSQ